MARPNGCGDDEAAEILRSTNQELWEKAWAQIWHKDPRNWYKVRDAKALWYKYIIYRDDAKEHHQEQQRAAGQTQQRAAEAAACHEERAAAASSSSMARQQRAVTPEFIAGDWRPEPPSKRSIWAAEMSAESRGFDLSCLPASIRPGAHAKWGISLWCEECKEYVAWVSRSNGSNEFSQDGGCPHFSGREYQPALSRP